MIPIVETNPRKIVLCLEREGWVGEHGGDHDLFRNPRFPDLRTVVPHHRELSPGLARDIAKKAGW